jgi:predicted ATPase
VLRNCPTLKVLVTSRETLKLEEEYIFVLEGLPFPKITDAQLSYPDDDKLGDAVQLFRERAQQVKAQFEPNGQLADVLRICGLVEGLPLGIELAASWVRVMACADIADEIEKGLEFLTTTTLNVPERHRSLKAAFDYSWQLLSQKEQEILRKLSVFVGGFRREAANEVAGATIPLLASLVDKSLFRVSPTGRYDQHPLLHQFAREKLEEQATEQTQTREEHGAHYFRFLKSVEEAIKGPTQKEVLDTIEEELENVRAAWQWALKVGRLEKLQQSSQTLGVFFDLQKRLREGVGLFSEALTRMRDDGSIQPAALGTVSTAQARLLYQLGHYDEAAKLAWQSVDIFRTVKDDQSKMLGLNLNTLASVAWRLGNHHEAKQYWEQALMLAKTQGRDKEITVYLGNLALVETTLGDYEVAEKHLKEALALSHEHKNYHNVALNLISLGNLYLNMGKLQTAKTYWEDGFELAKDKDLHDTIPFFLINLGVVAYELGNYSQANMLSKEALHKFRENEDMFLEAFVLAKLGKIATALEEYALARDYFRQALTVAQEIKGPSALIEAVIGLAELCAKQGNTDQAASLFSLVLHHTATVQADKDHAQQQLNTLQHQLSFEDIEEAIERGKTLTLEEVVAEFIGQNSNRRLHLTQ